MKKTLLCLASFVVSLSGFQGVAAAAVDTSAIPADAKWMVQVDFVALRESPVGRELLDMAEKNADLKLPSASVKIDVRKVLATVESATAYGTVFSKNPDLVDGTLLIKGTDELRKIAEAVVTQASISQPDTVAELKGLPFPAYVIKGKVTIAFPPEPVVLVSRSQPQLLKAYDLYRGKGPSSARAQSSLKAMAPQNRPLIVFAASEVPNTDGLFDENQPQARILKMASAASVAVGNDGKLTSATVQLVASNDDYSDKLLKIVQGMVAMLSLAQSDDKQLNEFMQSVKAERTGRNIVVSFAYPNDGLIQMLHNLGQAPAAPAVPPAHKNHKSQISGRVVDTWKAGDDEEGGEEEAGAFKTRLVEKVALKNGTALILTGERDEDGRAGLDCVDVEPAAGGQPLHFEAENMKLWHYKAAKNRLASGGREIALEQNRTGTAKIEFPGVDGTYTVKVRYRSDDDGESRFTLSVQDPEPNETDNSAIPAAPAAPQAPAMPALPGAE